MLMAIGLKMIGWQGERSRRQSETVAHWLGNGREIGMERRVFCLLREESGVRLDSPLDHAIDGEMHVFATCLQRTQFTVDDQRSTRPHPHA